MGSKTSKTEKFDQSHVKIKVEDLLDSKANSAHSTFCQQLRYKGYSVISLDTNRQQLIRQYKRSAADFFSMSINEKKKYAPKQEDELLRELGSVPNEGYVLTPVLNKEYIKFKPSHSASAFPPDSELKNNFDLVWSALHPIAFNCFNLVAHYKGPDMKEKLMVEDVYSQAQEFADIRSSISVIKYWKRNEREKYLDNSGVSGTSDDKDKKTDTKTENKEINEENKITNQNKEEMNKLDVTNGNSNNNNNNNGEKEKKFLLQLNKNEKELKEQKKKKGRKRKRS